MNMPALTTGCIMQIMNDDDYKGEPILQLLTIKCQNPSPKDNITERYCLLLSDGRYMEGFFMLATHLNHLIAHERLADFAVVQLKDYITSVVTIKNDEKRRVLIITALEILKPGLEVKERIGDPIFLSGIKTQKSFGMNTPGCLKEIMTGDVYEGEPILQVLGTKRIVGTNAERYRILLSDGQYCESFVMLSTHLNHLVVNGQLTEFTIIRVKQHTTSVVTKNKNHPDSESRRILIIIAIDVLKPGTEVNKKIGDPISFPPANEHQTDKPKPVDIVEKPRRALNTDLNPSTLSLPSKVYDTALSQLLCLIYGLRFKPPAEQA